MTPEEKEKIETTRLEKRKTCPHFDITTFGCEDCFAGPEEVKEDLEKRKKQ